MELVRVEQASRSVKQGVMMRVLPLAVGALLLAAPLAAQTCKPGTNSREADLFAHFSVPLAFSAGQAPWIYLPGTILLGLEGTYVPDASDRIATATICQPGKGPEDVNLLKVYPRPRVGFPLPNGVLLEVSWTPPVTINTVKPNLWSFALSRTVLLNRKGTMFMGRLHATIGHVHAPFTCSADYVKDPANTICFGTPVSNDRYSPNIFGAELALGWAWARGRIRPYLGAGYNIMHPRFQVHHGADDTKIEVNLSRVVGSAGVTVAPTARFNLSAEAYAAPSDLVTARVRATLLVGGPRR
jgi:hypothetical protein